MKSLKHKIEQDVVLNEDTTLNGMIVGETTVSNGAILELRGMIIGDLILLERSLVKLFGMVNGDVINKGGTLEVFGMVNGKIIIEDGQITVDPDAIIRNGIINARNKV